MMYRGYFISRACRWLAFTVLLAGCSSLHRDKSPDIALIDASIPSHWRCRGKIAIKPTDKLAAQGVKTRVVNFNWQQAGENTSLTLSGSFGLGRVVIEASPELATIRRGDKILSQAESLSELVWANTGIELPTKNLRYWLLGKPEPGVSYNLIESTSETDIPNFLQSGWQIDYKRSRRIEPFVLPEKLNANSDEFYLRVAIQSWDLSSQDPAL